MHCLFSSLSKENGYKTLLVLQLDICEIKLFPSELCCSLPVNCLLLELVGCMVLVQISQLSFHLCFRVKEQL